MLPSSCDARSTKGYIRGDGHMGLAIGSSEGEKLNK